MLSKEFQDIFLQSIEWYSGCSGEEANTQKKKNKKG